MDTGAAGWAQGSLWLWPFLIGTGGPGWVQGTQGGFGPLRLQALCEKVGPSTDQRLTHLTAGSFPENLSLKTPGCTWHPGVQEARVAQAQSPLRTELCSLRESLRLREGARCWADAVSGSEGGV